VRRLSMCARGVGVIPHSPAGTYSDGDTPAGALLRRRVRERRPDAPRRRVSIETLVRALRALQACGYDDVEVGSIERDGKTHPAPDRASTARRGSATGNPGCIAVASGGGWSRCGRILVTSTPCSPPICTGMVGAVGYRRRQICDSGRQCQQHRRRRARSRDGSRQTPQRSSGDTHSTASRRHVPSRRRIGTEKVVLVRFGYEQPEKTLLILMGAFGDRVRIRCTDRPIKRVCAGGGVMSDLPPATPTACVVCGAPVAGGYPGRRPRSTPSMVLCVEHFSEMVDRPKGGRQNDPRQENRVESLASGTACIAPQTALTSPR